MSNSTPSEALPTETLEDAVETPKTPRFPRARAFLVRNSGALAVAGITVFAAAKYVTVTARVAALESCRTQMLALVETPELDFTSDFENTDDEPTEVIKFD